MEYNYHKAYIFDIQSCENNNKPVIYPGEEPEVKKY